jgi:predicted nucleic acid-binding protein
MIILIIDIQRIKTYSMKIYLDNCCFNRPFDNQLQLRIRLETEAKLKIQEHISQKKFDLIWSYILDFENNKNIFRERREQISKWAKYAIQDIEESAKVLDIAAILNEKGLKKFDSLHIACAIEAGADFFLTTDDGILKKVKFITEIHITDPIGFIKEVSI